MPGAGEEVHRGDGDRVVRKLGKNGQVPGQRGRVAADIYQALGGHFGGGTAQRFPAAFAGRIQNDDIGR